MPRFAVLEHHWNEVHWDFLFEDQGVLTTWALDQLPIFDRDIPARKLADHRIMYLDYEGPVSNNRGFVTRWDEGVYEPTSRSDDSFETRLSGGKLVGSARFWRNPTGFKTAPGAVDAPDVWLFRLSGNVD